jgi:hypothetical protein
MHWMAFWERVVWIPRGGQEQRWNTSDRKYSSCFEGDLKVEAMKLVALVQSGSCFEAVDSGSLCTTSATSILDSLSSGNEQN